MKKKMFNLCGPLFWLRFDFDCWRHCSLSDWGDRELGNSSLRTAGIALETQQSVWGKVFLPLFVFIAHRCPINRDQCCSYKTFMSQTEYCSFSSGFCDTQRISKACNKEHLPSLPESSVARTCLTVVEKPKQESCYEPFLPSSLHWFKLVPTGFILPWTASCSSPGTLCLKQHREALHCGYI